MRKNQTPKVLFAMTALLALLPGCGGNSTAIRNDMSANQLFDQEALLAAHNLAVVAKLDPDLQLTPSALHLQVNDVKINSNAAEQSLQMPLGQIDLTQPVLMAFDNLAVGTNVHMLRLILDDEGNEVHFGDATHPLSTPSSQQSGYKGILAADCVIEANKKYAISIFFTLLQKGNGDYLLKPTGKISCVEGDEELPDDDEEVAPPVGENDDDQVNNDDAGWDIPEGEF